MEIVAEQPYIAAQRVLALIETMGRYGIDPSGSSAFAQPAVENWLRDYLLICSGKELEDPQLNAVWKQLVPSIRIGEPLTQLLQIQGSWGITARAAISGGSPYPNPNVKITLENISGGPLLIKKKIRTYDVPPIRSVIGGVATTIGEKQERTEIHEHTLQPGERLTIPVNEAALALAEQSVMAHEPDLWGSSSAIPSVVKILEVGFDAQDAGPEPISYEPPKRRKAS